MHPLHSSLSFSAYPFILETAVQGSKVMQDFELESLTTGGDHSQKVKAPLVVNDYGSKDCVDLPPSTAVYRFMPVSGRNDQNIQLSLNFQDPCLPLGFHPEALNCLALDQGYGFKTAHLHLLKGLLESLRGKLRHCEAAVPEFAGISHQEIRSFLDRAMPELDALWKQFLLTCPQEARERFLETDSAASLDWTLSSEGLLLLEKIQMGIREAFRREAFSPSRLAELVERCHPEWMIVRSTGREDSLACANAGGNESVSLVAPTSPCVAEAIGKVVASYFGPKSIIQRIQAGDRSLLVSEPFLPVLLQEMICERKPVGIESAEALIPRSGVLFAERDTAGFELVTINAAWGSNEGVVSSQVVVDTYQIHAEGGYSTIRVQPTRFAPIPRLSGISCSLGLVPNKDVCISHSAVLTSSMIADLAVVAKECLALYSKGSAAIDMEFTFLPKKDGAFVLYLLQMRPLEEIAPSQACSLDLETYRQLDPEKRFWVGGYTLLDGGASVRTVSCPALQVIIAEDIAEALAKYQSHSSPATVEAVLIRRTAPLTSHECVTLRSRRIPVIVIKNAAAFLKARTLLNASSKAAPSLIDPQRGAVVQVQRQEDAALLIQPGLIAYPGPLELSLKHPGILSVKLENLNEEELQRFLERLDAKIERLLADLPVIPYKNGDYAVLFDRMALGPEREALGSVRHLIKKMRTLFYATLELPSIDSTLARELVACMAACVNVCAGHVLKGLKAKPQSSERLFPLKQLRALLEQPFDPRILGCASLLHICQALRASCKIQPRLLGLPEVPLAKVLIGAGFDAAKEEFKSKWEQFLATVFQKEGLPGLRQLKGLLSRMRVFGVQVFWLNVTFQDHLHPTVQILKEECQQEESVFGVLEGHLLLLAGWEASIGRWADPSFYRNKQPHLDADYASMGFDGGPSSSMARLYQNAGNLGKAAILEFIQRALEVYDASIKALTGSILFRSKGEQAGAFAELLERYFEILRTAVQIAAPYEAEITRLDGANAQAIQQTYRLDLLTTYLTYLKEKDFKIQRTLHNTSPDFTVYHGKAWKTLKQEIKHLDEAGCNRLFLIRESFNVAAVAIGSHTDLTFCIYWPQTLEELFTTIHQSTEALVKTMRTKIGLDHTRLPAHIVPMCKGIEQATQQTIAKMSLSEGVVDVVYQIPLRSHAAEVRIRTRPSQPEKGYELHMTVFGNEETNRWKITATFAALLAELPGCAFLDRPRPKLNFLNPVGTGVSFQLRMTPDCVCGPQFGVMFKQLLMPGGITYDAGHSSPLGLVDGVASREGFNQVFPSLKKLEDWLSLSEAFYSATLFPNLPLLNCSLENNRPDAVKKIIIGTCVALVVFGHRDVEEAEVRAWLGFSYLFSQGGVKCTVGQLARHYDEQVPKPAGMGNLSYLRAVYYAFYHLLMLHPEHALEVFLALRADPRTFAGLRAFLDQLEGLLKIRGVEIPSAASTSAVSIRFDCFRNLKCLAEDVRVLGMLPASELLLKKSMDALMGLAQSSDWMNFSAQGVYKNLESYLGTPLYAKVVKNNVYNQTAKLYKAAVFYLIAGLQSKNETLQYRAFRCTTQLIEDYLRSGKEDPMGDSYEEILYALFYGAERAGKLTSFQGPIYKKLLGKYEAWKIAMSD